MPSQIETIMAANPPEKWWPVDIWQKGDETVIVVNEEKYNNLPKEHYIEIFNWICVVMQTFQAAGLKAWVDKR